MSNQTQNKSFWTRSSQPISWPSTEKLKQTQKSKHASVTKLYNIKWTQKTKARFGRLLRPPAWKRNWLILVSALHKFVTYILT